MANQLTRKVLLDGYRNAVVKLTGVLDTSDISETPAITLAHFQNNEQNANLAGFRVDRITYVIGQGLEIQLQWNGTPNPETIVAIAGRGTMEGYHYGGLSPNQSNPGYDGSINLITTGYGMQPIYGTVQNFSITLEMTKQYTV